MFLEWKREEERTARVYFEFWDEYEKKKEEEKKKGEEEYEFWGNFWKHGGCVGMEIWGNGQAGPRPGSVVLSCLTWSQTEAGRLRSPVRGPLPGGR